MAQVLLGYFNNHGKNVRNKTNIKLSCRYWMDFFAEATIEEATAIHRQEKFVQWLSDQGHSTAYQQRIVGVGKAALNWARRRGMISTVPYIISVDVHYGEPKGRVLSPKEVALLLTHAPDHVRLFIYIMLGTLCRPEAAYELTGAQLDFENRLIDLNPPGETLAGILENSSSGHVITYRGKPIKYVRSAWRSLRTRCGLDDNVQPYSLRHTMARWLRKQGVSAWDTAAQLGHKSREYSTTEIYAPYDPDYLDDAARAIDAYFDVLRANYAPVPQQFFAPKILKAADISWINGAAEKIRTSDLSLTKGLIQETSM